MSAANAYPLDAYPETGTLAGSRVFAWPNEGKVADVKQPKGAMLPLKAVDLRLVGSTFDLPPSDPELDKQLAGILGGGLAGYGVAILDLLDSSGPCTTPSTTAPIARTSAASGRQSRRSPCSRRSPTRTPTTSRPGSTFSRTRS